MGRRTEGSARRWSLGLAAGLLLPLGLALAACRGPAGMSPDPLEPLAHRAAPVPDEPDLVAHDLAAAALGGDTAATRREQAQLQALEQSRREAGDPPTGLAPYGRHLVDATLGDEIAYRRASAELLRHPDVPPALRSELNADVADDPLAIAQARLWDSRQARIARDVNAFSQAIGTSIVTTVFLPVRLFEAALGVALAEHMDEPISLQERQALAEWKEYVETHPDSPEAPALLGRIEGLQQSWFAMKRERSVRAARKALDQGEDDVALVLSARALAYAPEDGEASKLRAEAEQRVLARRAARARSLAAPDAPPPDASNRWAAALDRALLDPQGDVDGAARAVRGSDGGRFDDGARYAQAVVAGERGDEASEWATLGQLAGEDDATHPMARHARTLVESPTENPYAAFERARVDAVGQKAGFVLLGPLAHGARDRDLPRAVEWLLEAPSLVSTLGGIPARLVQTAVAPQESRAPAVYAQTYLARYPHGTHAEAVRSWLVGHWSSAGDPIRAWRAAKEDPATDPARLADLERKAADQMLEVARKQKRRDLRFAMLGEIAGEHPDTKAGREAAALARKEIEEATPQRIRISRGFLTENPAVAGPDGLGLRPELLDGRLENGELHPDGVWIIGGRTLEFALLAPSGSPKDPPRIISRTVSAERLARLVSMLEETSLHDALVDPLAEQGADARRDYFFERATLGVTDSVDPRPMAESTYAFLGTRERYGMVRSRESILPVELVLQGTFPDLGLGAFPRLKGPKPTPDAILYR
jgi:hypothetical protein